eukprot:m.184260 g.184260  ORF g.184260 m.184260 type:complete len:249 (-) comp15008_c0_seq3:249-995(-)
MSGPWGHLGQAVADVFDIAAPRTTEELEALVNRLFTSQNFRFEATPQSVIDALDEHRLTPGELADNVSCTICLIDFKDTDRVLKLECSHLYHRECLVPWLTQQATCPLCRHRVGPGPSDPTVDGSQSDDSIHLARMLAHFVPRIVSGAGLGAAPQTGYPTTTVNVTANPYAHYRAPQPQPHARAQSDRPVSDRSQPRAEWDRSSQPPGSQPNELRARREAAAAAAERRRLADGGSGGDTSAAQHTELD